MCVTAAKKVRQSERAAFKATNSEQEFKMHAVTEKFR